MEQSDWYVRKFNDEEVTKLKEDMEAKQKILAKKYPNKVDKFVNDVGTKWCGDAGEIAFKSYLKNFGYHFEHHTVKDDFDLKDFTIGTLKVDVKTISTKYYPKMYYGCDVVAPQVEKIRNTNDINALVFSRYMRNTDEAIVMGWLTFEKFEELSEFQTRGTKLGAIIIENDQYEVQIKDLWELSKLRMYLQHGFVI